VNTDITAAMLDGRSLPEILADLRPSWMNDGLCNEYQRDLFFPGRGSTSAQAKRICGQCAVRPECLAYAVNDGSLLGVWGGTSDRERQQLRGQRAA